MSSNVTQAPRESPTFSSLGRATLDIAARLAGWSRRSWSSRSSSFSSIRTSLNPDLGGLDPADDELGRHHGARAHAGDRGRRDRLVVRRDVRPRPPILSPYCGSFTGPGLAGDPDHLADRGGGRTVQRRPRDQPEASPPSSSRSAATISCMACRSGSAIPATFNPNYPPREGPADRPARFLHRPDPEFGKYQLSGEVFWMLGRRHRGRLPASPLAVRLPADGDRRQSRGREARAAASQALQGHSPSFSARPSPRSPAFSISRSFRRASRTSASRKPSRSSPPSSSAARASAAARDRSSGRSAARCCSRNSDRPRAAFARAACSADFPGRGHDHRGRARPAPHHLRKQPRMSAPAAGIADSRPDEALRQARSR